ncbi:MAG: ribosome small subunit-dependent GTPase A [Bacteroidales bacterium]|nr:ribosome small subunit-dependent GTPase A [Bacteroidales bacterium]
MSHTVVKHTGSHYLVSPLPLWEPVPCVVRGKIRLKGSATTNPIAVGDKVEVTDGVITVVHQRKNYIIRKSSNLSRQEHIIAANLDGAFLIVTMVLPETRWEFVDRFLMTCEAYKIPVVIVLNKIDIQRKLAPKVIARFKEVYEGAGYPVWETSALTGEGVDRLRKAICNQSNAPVRGGRVSLFSGISGVGKSSLINALGCDLTLRTGVLSDYHLKGKHTTTFYEMFPVADGFVIDSPGIKGFGLVEVGKEEVYHFFPELFKAAINCRFNPCTHTHEPDCAVMDGLNKGIISPERYDSYVKILEEENGKYR